MGKVAKGKESCSPQKESHWPGWVSGSSIWCLHMIYVRILVLYSALKALHNTQSRKLRSREFLLDNLYLINTVPFLLSSLMICRITCNVQFVFRIINDDAPMPSHLCTILYNSDTYRESARNNKIALDKLQFSNKLNARQNAGQSDDRQWACRRPVLLH